MPAAVGVPVMAMLPVPLAGMISPRDGVRDVDGK